MWTLYLTAIANTIVKTIIYVHSQGTDTEIHSKCWPEDQTDQDILEMPQLALMTIQDSTLLIMLNILHAARRDKKKDH